MKRKKKLEELDILKTQISAHNKKFNYENFLNIEIKKKGNSNSWFDIKKVFYNSDCCLTLPKPKSESEFIKCKQVILLPSDEQKKIMLGWLEAFRLMYNETVKMIRILKKEGNKKYLNWQYIRTHKLKEIKQKYVNKYKVPVHTLDKAINLVCSNWKSALTNLRNGYTKHFTIRYIKQTKPKQIFQVEKSSFSKGGFCTKVLGKIMINKEDLDYKTIKCDSTLSYDVRKDIFLLHIPYRPERIIKPNKNSIIGIDPGLKTFLTCVSDDRVIKIGNNIIEKFSPQLKRIDYLNKFNNKKSRRLVKIIYTRMKNQIVDLHWKSINYLVAKKNIGGIIIGNWSTKDTASKKKFLDPTFKRISGMLSIFKFRERLKFKCNEYNIPYVLADESYTSKTCSKCASVNSEIKKRTLRCSNCNFCIDRDFNGALNILFKYTK